MRTMTTKTISRCSQPPMRRKMTTTTTTTTTTMMMERARNAVPAAEMQSVTERTTKATKTAKTALATTVAAAPAMLLTNCFALASAELVAPTGLGNAIQTWLESETACAAVV